MSKSLVVVESPAKAKTVSRLLGGQYKILASVGHVKDLPKNALGVDLEKDFCPKYEVIHGKNKVLQEIRKAAEGAENIYLATDPDREGEAIAWHIAEEIRRKNTKIYRILFHEITRHAVEEALAHPLVLNQNKFESQQARRILDRLVGYQISPLLWEKVQRGLSAGRVQSVAVKIIVDRELEIRRFISEEYWAISATYLGSKEPSFIAKLIKTDGAKPSIGTGAEANALVEELRHGTHLLSRVEKKERRRHPVPPFITSKLQQEASRRLRFSPKLTMMVAQQLYEGVELGEEGSVGLISYMRTDSTRVSDQALGEVRSYIENRYGRDYLPESPNYYKNRKGSQDAHEAIRPTSMNHHPERVAQYLTVEQRKLYQLIFERFVASQMNPAVYDATIFDVTSGRHMLRAVGQVLKFAGFTKVYTERMEENGHNGEEAQGNVTLPDLAENETLRLTGLDPKQNFTQPPPRFSEAMLVKELEERGIGRPSTYATILSTIQEKNYSRKEEGRLRPTELGEIVTGLLNDAFPTIMDSEFTARLEEQLDDVEDGKAAWLDILRAFYGPFAISLDQAKEKMRNVKREETPTGLTCPKCNKGLVVKWGRNGSFVGCPGYPDCDFTSEFTRDGQGLVRLVEKETGTEVCDQCGGMMLLKNGRFGKFLACSNYPKCHNTKPVKVGMKCPEKDCTGEIIEKRTRKGRLFFGCNQFPKCRFASWDRPRPEICPSCNAPYMVEKSSNDGGTMLKCPACSFTREVKITAQPEENAASENNAAQLDAASEE